MQVTPAPHQDFENLRPPKQAEGALHPWPRVPPPETQMFMFTQVHQDYCPRPPGYKQELEETQSYIHTHTHMRTCTRIHPRVAPTDRASEGPTEAGSGLRAKSTHWLLWQRARVWFPAPRWELTTICKNPIAIDLMLCYSLQGDGMHSWYTYIHAGKALI